MMNNELGITDEIKIDLLGVTKDYPVIPVVIEDICMQERDEDSYLVYDYRIDVDSIYYKDLADISPDKMIVLKEECGKILENMIKNHLKEIRNQFIKEELNDKSPD